jgi:hypothetical protein
VAEAWPALPLESWKDTFATLHRWVQIVGKVRLAQTPWLNHSWHATLYVTPRGLTTGPIPHGPAAFQIDFDFVDHQLVIRKSDGSLQSFALAGHSVAGFYRDLMSALSSLELKVKIYARPNELPDATPFAEDEQHASYDPAAAQRFSQALVQVDRVLNRFRARFQGKSSPVHLFWGALDLAVTRFSGRPAPRHPGGVPNLPDWVARDAYSHEVSSAGFWPGGPGVPHAAFYSYAYPEPDGYRDAKVRPSAAYYHPDLREFILPDDAVRTAADPDRLLLEFLQSTYEAAANLGRWDRDALEQPGDPRPVRA